MAKHKLFRFSENETFPNLIQLPYTKVIEGVPHKGKWAKDFFNNKQSLILELGCGKGEYTIGLAKRYPENNFIGVDVKGARLWRGCRTSNDEQMNNVGFIRTQIELIDHYFEKEEVSEIWITFPDPQPKEFKARKRLTNPLFLERYRKFLAKDGLIHLKTDNTPFFDYTLEVIKEEGHHLIFHERDVYNSDCEGALIEIQTFYEKKYLELGQPIHYLKFQLNEK